MIDRPPTVLYIAGSGRSGSTLLERVLAGMTDMTTVGELLDLPRRVAPHDEMCGCEVAFSQCPWWLAVGRSCADWDPQWLGQLHQMQAQVARQRHLPRLLTAGRDSPFQQAVQDYGDRYRQIVAAVAAQAGVKYVVDASKWPALALALHRGGIDIRVIHLVRDVRGVAHSLSKADIKRPHASSGDLTNGRGLAGGNGGDLMFHNSPAGGAARWLATQTEMDLLRLRGVRVARLAYDDFVRAPAASLTTTLAQLEITVPPASLSHISGTSVDLGPSHGLSGNPSRFRHGLTQLRPDQRWRTQMRPLDRWLAAGIGLPYLARLKAGSARLSAAPATVETSP
jgi:hypothetical protein